MGSNEPDYPSARLPSNEVMIPDEKPGGDVVPSDPCLGLKICKLLGCRMDRFRGVGWRFDHPVSPPTMGSLRIHRGDPAASPRLLEVSKRIVPLSLQDEGSDFPPVFLEPSEEVRDVFSGFPVVDV